MSSELLFEWDDPGRRATGASEPPTLPTIVLHATDVDHLTCALSGCAVHLHWVEDADAAGALPRGSASSPAIVAIDDDPLRAATAVGIVHALRQNGCSILCYQSDGGHWPLRRQCALLLAGASHLLDAGDPGFQAELRAWIDRALHEGARRQRESRDLQRQMLDLGVVGSGPAIVSVFRWVLKAAALSDLPVLISGETGTGKELVARALHCLDPARHNGPFVPVNCGAISAGLAESELFGHRRGAFTGADRDRKGLIRAAIGGVLFLDEVADLDATLQGKLLRVIQERRVLSLGDDHEMPTDVRIVAATNRHLETMVAAGTFRVDLYHRLSVLSVRLPPLRERPEDIEPLVRYFLERAARDRPERLRETPAFLEALKTVDLSGNVRQLEGLVRRAALMADDEGRVQLSALPSELLCQLADGAAPSVSGAPASLPVSFDPVAVLEAQHGNLERALDFCERGLVTAALGISRGNRARAARLLGISPRSMFNKMRKHRPCA